MVLKVQSDETGAGAWAWVTVHYAFRPAEPALKVSPNVVQTGVAWSNIVTEALELENIGYASMDGVEVSVVDETGVPAPPWIAVLSASNLGTLEVGEKRRVEIAFQPNPDVPEGVYTYYLRVRRNGATVQDILMGVSVSQAGVGGVLFKAKDMYTETLDEHGAFIEGVSGARISLTHEVIGTIRTNLTTDASGEALFEDLPVGQYRIRVTSSDHDTYTGRIWIKPGVVASRELALKQDLVTFEWEVVPTTIEDRYEVVLHTIFKTDVPGAVVVMEPASVTLPDMDPGEVFHGEIKLTNHGLVRADQMNLNLPSSDEYLLFETLVDVPETLEAKEEVTIPYRVTRLKNKTLEEDGAAGGGATADGFCYEEHWIYNVYHYICDNGLEFDDIVVTVLYAPVPCTTPTGPPTGNHDGGGGELVVDDGDIIINAPGAFPRFAPEEEEGFDCVPVFGIFGLTFDQLMLYKVGSDVHLAAGQFVDRVTDVGLRGLSAERGYNGQEWVFVHSGESLRTQPPERVYRGSDRLPIFAYAQALFACLTTWRDTDRFGNWYEYNCKGWRLASGDLNGTNVTYVYDPSVEGRILGVKDRNGVQAFTYEYNGDGRVNAVQDRLGRRVEYHYTNGLMAAVDGLLADQQTYYAYDSTGRLTQVTYPDGEVERIHYNALGYVTSVVDGTGQGTVFRYDFDRVRDRFYTRSTTSGGLVTEKWFDFQGRLLRSYINGERDVEFLYEDARTTHVTDGKGETITLDYDEWGNLTTVSYPDGVHWQYTYEHVHHRMIKAVDALGRITHFQYDNRGNLTNRIEAAGTSAERVMSMRYTSRGLLTEMTIQGDAHTASATWRLMYDPQQRLTAITDPMSNSWTIAEYSATGVPQRMVDPLGREMAFAFDLLGRVTNTYDSLGREIATEYDASHRPTVTTDARGKPWSYEYDERGNIAEIVDPNGNAMAFSYGPDGLPSRIQDALGVGQEWTLDNMGRVREANQDGDEAIGYDYADPILGEVAQIRYPTFTRKFTFDKRIRRATEIEDVWSGGTNRTEFVYDKAGNVLRVTGPEGKTVSYAYDARNRLVAVTNAAGDVSSRIYDDRDNVIATIDQAGMTNRFVYDRNDRLIQEIASNGRTFNYRYDALGNMTNIVDGNGQITQFAHDRGNRVTQTLHFASAVDVIPEKRVTYAYNEMDQLEGWDDGTVRMTYVYDDAGRKTREVVDYGPFALTNTYGFYENDLKASYTGPNGITYTYTYDDANNLRGIDIPGQGQITWDTYRWKHPTRISLPGGSTVAFAHNGLMDLAGVEAKDPAGTQLLLQNYVYSPMGLVLSNQTEHGAYAYTYDLMARLTRAENPTGEVDVYTYDAVGNRTSSARQPGVWSYGTNNELLVYGDIDLEYDGNGNLKRKSYPDGKALVFFYDASDQLVRIENEVGAEVASYYYDPFGRRLWKEVSGTRTYFLYADEGLVGEFSSAGTEQRSYGYAPGVVWMSNPLFLRIGTSYYWYLNDRMGVPQKIISTSGSIVWAATYDAFGRAHESVTVVANPLRFTGQYEDPETGLHYNWHRYYDPDTGRYTTVDPARDGGNHYVYCANNPLSCMDPNGLKAIPNPHVMGAFRAAGGAFEMIAGLVYTVKGGGLTVYAGGGLLMLNGLDNFIAGLRQAFTGEPTEAFLEAGIRSAVELAGGGQTTASFIYIGSQILIPFAAVSLAGSGGLATSAQSGIGANGLYKMPTGPESATLRQMYMREVDSLTYRGKLFVHNMATPHRTWVTPGMVKDRLANSTFRLGNSSVAPMTPAGQMLPFGQKVTPSTELLIGGNTSSSYFNRTVIHHEMIHINQMIKNPTLTRRFPWRSKSEFGTLMYGHAEYFWPGAGALSYGVWELSN